MKNRILAFGLLLAIGVGFAFTKTNKTKLHIPFLNNEDLSITTDRNIKLPEWTTEEYTDTIPRTSGKSKISVMENGKSITIEKENGKITKMEVDGEEVNPSEYDKYMKDFGTFDIDGNNLKFRSGPDFKFFHFGDEDVWNGFNDEEFGMLFKNLDSMRTFNWDGFNMNMDSMNSQFQGMEELLKGLRENMNGFKFDFKDLDELRNFNFDQDFGSGFNFDFDNNFPRSSGKISDRLGRALNEDGLLVEGVDNKVELTGKHLKINGEKQPSNIHQKYKKMFEEYSGIDVTSDSKIDLTIEGKKPRKSGLRRI